MKQNEMVIEPIKRFYENDFITSEHLDNLIKELGKQEIVFSIPDYNRPEIKRNFIIVDRNDIEKYSPHYKIYLLSTDLEKSESFYTSDLIQLIRNGSITVHYRWDLVAKEKGSL